MTETQKIKPKTLVINLFAGSGAGKSTLAAALYAKLKVDGVNVELIREFIKKWAWEGKIPSRWDQVFILGSQINSESDLYEKVECIVTDSPILLVPFFEDHLLKKDITRNVALAFMNYAEEHGIKYVNFWLQRPENFDQRGRFETKEQAINVDIKMKKWLKDLGVDLIELPIDHQTRVDMVLAIIKEYS
jgi:predicted ATPase